MKETSTVEKPSFLCVLGLLCHRCQYCINLLSYRTLPVKTLWFQIYEWTAKAMHSPSCNITRCSWFHPRTTHTLSVKVVFLQMEICNTMTVKLDKSARFVCVREGSLLHPIHTHTQAPKRVNISRLSVVLFKQEQLSTTDAIFSNMTKDAAFWVALSSHSMQSTFIPSFTHRHSSGHLCKVKKEKRKHTTQRQMSGLFP